MTNINYWQPFPANFSNGESVSNISSFLEYINVLTTGWFGLFLIVLIGVVSFFTMKAFNVEKAMGATTFITFILSIILFNLEMLSIQWVIVIGILMVGSMLVLRKQPGQQI